MNVGIINTLTSNIKSVLNVLNYLGFENRYEVINNISEIKKEYSHLILPGNGNYKSNMDIIKKKNFNTLIKNHFLKNKPFLGICVGMQILSTFGEETSFENGLNIIEGRVTKIKTTSLRLPHIGWNNIEVTNNDPILKNINEEDTFYFLHSYFFDVKNKSNIIATTKYEIEIPIFVKKNKFYGVQFHPEKSQNSGIKIIDNFLKIS